VKAAGCHADRAQELHIGPENRAREVVLTRSPVALPVDEQARSGRRRQVPLPGPRFLGKGGRPGFGGVAEDDGYLLVEPLGVLGEVAGEGLVGMSGLDGRADARLRAVEPGGEPERLLGRGGLAGQQLRARGAALELRDGLNSGVRSRFFGFQSQVPLRPSVAEISKNRDADP
jgi:hypothetical protein